jgi:MSHA type pilus biogenesis protein MshL
MVMKMKCLSLIFLSLLLAGGCATAPKKERTKLPSQTVEPAKPPLPPEEKLKELVVPQKEEVKKVPEKLYSFFAREANVQDVLLTFSKESDLNIIVDPELIGKVTIDLKRVTLKEALDAILSPLGWTHRQEGKFIRILRPQVETRLFTLNYIATKRTGKREIYASTGGGTQSGAPPGPQATIASMGIRAGYSDLVSVDEMDFWKEVQKGLEAIIFGTFEEKEKEAPSETGKATWTKVDGKGKKLIINKSTGVIWVTDYSPSLHKVASFLETIEGTSQRQVTIQAKILEVILSDEFKAGINWKVIQGLPRSINLAWGLTDQAGTTGFPGGATGYISGTEAGVGTIPTPGVFKVNPFGGIFALGAAGTEILLSNIIQAISEQGDLKVLSSPTISTLNNQKAIIRVGNQDVYFITGAVATQTAVTQTVQPVTIDVGITLDVTPQIAEDGTIIMNIHPSITEKTGEKPTPDGKTTFPLLSVRETDTTVRVKDNQTIIIAGLMQEKIEETYIGVPGLQSIPLLGALFRYKTESKRNSELVIMITPTLQVGKKVEDSSRR